MGNKKVVWIGLIISAQYLILISVLTILRKEKNMTKYSKSAGKDVEREMKKMKDGILKSGHSGKMVHSREQAIAIGLSEARKEGKRVPENPNKKS